MAQFETWLESDLKKPLKVVRLETGLFSQDNQGNLIGVTILSNGQTATVTGDVYGYVIRDDAETVVIPGTLTNNKASIVLPLSAYVVPGQVSIVIKVGATTVAACTGYVTRSMTDIIVDPAHVIPNLEELLEKIADMETATTAANTAAQYANEKGGLADEKATLANTKAGLADEKATLANQKAGLADQAATNANTVALKLGSMTVTITALDPGSQATAQMITDPETGDKTLALGIPRGEAFRIVKTYASIAAMEADFSGTDVHEGEYVAIVSNVQDPDNAKIYIKGSSAWGFVLDMSGTAGIQGEQGIQGIQGVQGVSITGGSASGESTAKMLTLTLYDPLTETSSSETISLGNIKGDQGIQGIQGIQGYQGVGIIGATASGGATGKILTLTLKNPANNTTAEVQVNLGDLQGEQGIQGYQGVGVANVSASGTAVSKVLTFELYNPASGGSSYANVDLGNIKGDKGDPGDATIDDTAGAGDTDKVWSADKTVKELNGKADMIVCTESTPAPILTIPDGAENLPIKQLQVEIAPMQDLHGLEYPYPAGGGSNIFHGELNTICPATVTSGKITVSLKKGGSGTAYFRKYNENEEEIDSVTINNTSGDVYYKTVTMNQNVAKWAITQAAGNAYDLKIEVGETLTPYSNICPISGHTGATISVANGDDPTAEGYDVDTYNVSFPVGAGTVYGGTLTINEDGSGVLEVTHKRVQITTDIDWTASFSTSRMIYTAPDAKILGQDVTYADNRVVCSHFKKLSQTSGLGYIVNKNNQDTAEFLLFYGIGDIGIDTYEKWKTFITNNDLFVTYEMAEHQTYNLTALQVMALFLGQNCISADTGNVLSMTYPADTKRYVEKSLSASQRLIELIITANHEDGMVASKAYSSGDLLIVNGTLYKASTSIANGATLTVGTNVTATTVAAEIAALA